MEPTNKLEGPVTPKSIALGLVHIPISGETTYEIAPDVIVTLADCTIDRHERFLKLGGQVQKFRGEKNDSDAKVQEKYVGFMQNRIKAAQCATVYDESFEWSTSQVRREVLLQIVEDFKIVGER